MATDDRRRLRCSPDVRFRILDGEAVLLDLASGTYFGLNDVGTRVWQLIAEGREIDEVARILRNEFDVAEEVVTTDVRELVADLSRRGLLRAAEE